MDKEGNFFKNKKKVIMKFGMINRNLCELLKKDIKKFESYLRPHSRNLTPLSEALDPKVSSAIF